MGDISSVRALRSTNLPAIKSRVSEKKTRLHYMQYCVSVGEHFEITKCVRMVVSSVITLSAVAIIVSQSAPT